MPQPLMPKATAVWLIDNTALTFEQVAEFCGLHVLEVQGIADGEVAVGIVGLDPVANGQLSRNEIARCESDKSARLSLIKTDIPQPRRRTRGARYTPVSKRGDRPNAIAWMLKFHPEISDSQIQKLLGTTKATINAIRDRSHWNAQNIKPQDPVSLGICSQIDLDGVVRAARERREAKLRKEGIDPGEVADLAPLPEPEALLDDPLSEPVPEPRTVPEPPATAEDRREAAEAMFSESQPPADDGEDMADDPSSGESAETGAEDAPEDAETAPIAGPDESGEADRRQD
ncbi:MAG: DUF1013 domain-containing protein [Sneathiellaceae bacterium]